MKLAQALQERADLVNKTAELRKRLNNNATVQEGDKPQEDIEELLTELNSVIDRLDKLTALINTTNCSVKADGRTITELIAHRDAMRIKLNAYRELADEASQLVRRSSYSEIKVLPAVKVSDIQKQADTVAKELRETDALIQLTNWNTELPEV